jgi:hypothetical protein
MLVMVREEELCVVPYPPAVPNDPALLEKFTIRQNIRYVSVSPNQKPNIPQILK